jgi:hypothetical protein
MTADPAPLPRGLDAVPWDQFRDAYGPATPVPGFLRQLTSPNPDEREGGIFYLYLGICHQQCTNYEATAAAVPFLIELAGSDHVQDRQAILRLLASIVVAGSYLDAQRLVARVCAEHDGFWDSWRCVNWFELGTYGLPDRRWPLRQFLEAGPPVPVPDWMPRTTTEQERERLDRAVANGLPVKHWGNDQAQAALNPARRIREDVEAPAGARKSLTEEDRRLVEELELAGAVSDRLLAWLGECPNLTRLWATHGNLTDEGLAHLAALPRLTVLNLSDNGLTDAGLGHLARLTTLREIYLLDSAVTAEGVTRLRAALPGCEIVYLEKEAHEDQEEEEEAGPASVPEPDR